MTLVSRVLGLVREVLIAALFGAGAAMDAFFMAFRIPNLFRRLFAEGAFSQAFVPVFSEAKTTRTPEEAKRLVDVVAGTLGGVLALITALGILAAPLIMYLFAPGFADNTEKFNQAVALLRWMFPYLLFISLTAFAGGILNAYGKFAMPAFNPVWLNVCLIAAAWWWAPSVEALAISVFVAGIVQLLFLLPSLARLGLLPSPRWGWGDPQVRRIMVLMLPIMFGSSISQLSLLLDSIIASFLPGDGNVAWLYYADRLMEFPLGVFSIAIATVILPSLARLHATHIGAAGSGPSSSSSGFSSTLDWGLRVVLLVGLPATLGLFLLAGPLVSTLYQHGVITPRDVQMMSWALMAYAFAFLGFSLVKVLVPGFYARQETRVPVRYGVISLLAAMACSLVFTGLALWSGFVAPHAAIALATATGSWINAWLLWRRLHRDSVYRPTAGWRRFALQLLLANILMAGLILLLAGDVTTWTGAPASERILRLAVVLAAAVAVYFGSLWVSGLRLKHFRHAVG